jgi:hypothetical protein
VAELPDDHHCPWREEAEGLRTELADVQERLAAVTAAMEALTRRVLGPKSEKMPPPEKELRKDESDEDAEARRLAALERRRERAALKEKLRSETVIHHLGDDQRQCPVAEASQIVRSAPGSRPTSTSTCRATSCVSAMCRRRRRAPAVSSSRPRIRRYAHSKVDTTALAFWRTSR